MEIYILKHGEARDDIDNCYGGVADHELIEEGRNQAKYLAKQLHKCNIEAIFSSPLLRAHETAKIIAQELGNDIPVKVIDNLKERNSYGVLSGVNKNEAKIIFKDILDNLTEKPGYSREPILGAEDFDLFVQRINLAFKEVISTAQQKKLNRIAIVSHGTATRGIFEHVLDIGDIEISRTEIMHIKYQPAVINSQIL